MTAKTRECLWCGMISTQIPGDIVDRHPEPVCSKCDSPLWSQSDGSTVTVDIAHQRETVSQALDKFSNALNSSWQFSHAEYLRLVVGGGLIRDAVLAELFFLRSKGTVLDFTEENRGAVLVRIRPALL
ncbi:hypothetical protein [Pseudohongiella acticola]|nr:hypothetical protein [Pseudohongiella acticola]